MDEIVLGGCKYKIIKNAFKEVEEVDLNLRTDIHRDRLILKL